MAGVFLVLLYKSPSALLVYWTMNNVFSILKTFVLKKLGLSVGTVEAVQVRKEKSFRTNQKIFLKELFYFLPVLFCLLAFSLLAKIAYAKNFSFFIITTAFFALTSLLSTVYILIRKEKKLFILYSIFSIFAIYITLSFFLKDGRSPFISRVNFGLLVPLSFLLITSVYPVFYFFKKNEKQFTQAKISKKDLCLISISLAFFIFVYQPMLVFFSSPEDIGSSLKQIALISSLLFFAFCLIQISLSFLLKRKRLTLYLIKTSLFLSSLFYALLLKPNMGMLNGLTFQNELAIASLPLWRYVADPFIISGLFFLANRIIKKHKTIFTFFQIILLFVFTFHILNLAFSYKPASKVEIKTSQESPRLPESAAKNHVFSKTEQNVFYLLADMFNGNYLGRLIDENPEYKEKLDGFVWYPDCLSISSATTTSLPALWAGEDFLPHRLVNNGYTGKEELDMASEFLFTHITEAGYKITLANPYLVSEKIKETTATVNPSAYIPYWKKTQNYKDTSISIDYQFLPFIVSLFNASTWSMRNIIYDDAEWLIFRGAEKFSRFSEMAIKDIAYFDLLPQIATVQNGKGLFLYYHNNLAHDPYGINKDGELIKDRYPEESITNFANASAAIYSAKKVLDLLCQFIDWLKDEGIYDNTAIVVVSDHGNSFGDSDAPLSFFTNPLFAKQEAGRSQTLFLTKTFHSRGSLIKDESKISTADSLNYLLAHKIITDKKTLSFPPYHEERFYSVIDGDWEGGLHIDSPKYRTYKVTGPLAAESSWERIE